MISRYISKPQVMQEKKIGKMDINLQLLWFKRHRQERDETCTQWEKILANHVSDKALLSRMHKMFTTQKQTNNQFENGPSIWIDILAKKINKWPANTWKNAQHRYFWGNTNQDNNMSHPVEWLESKIQVITSADKDVEKLESSYIAGKI